MSSFFAPVQSLSLRFQQEKGFYKKLIALGLPIALQNLVTTSLNMLDTLMIGQLGETAIGAVALSNQIYFLMILLTFGISSGSSVFTAQFWGKRDMKGVHQSIGLSLVLGCTGAGLFTLAALFIPRKILGLFTIDQAVILQAVPYLRITALSYLFTAGTVIFQGALRSIGVVKLPLYISAGALSLNAFLNYALIFGKFGFPHLGITGAALATTGARVLETGILVSLIYLDRSPVAARVKEMTGQSRAFLKKYFWRVSPVILNEVGWSMGITMFTLIYARMGTSVLAAYNITDTFSRLAFVLFFGSANASAIVLGNMIGEGRQVEAAGHGRFLLLSVPLATTLMTAVVIIASPWIPLAFNVSPEVRSYIREFLVILAVFLLFKTSNMHIIVGILRSGGDTHYCMTIELLPLWLVSIPLVAAGGLILDFSPVLVYTLSMSEEVIKYGISLKRVFSGKWIHDLTG